ncbi:MAG TPA: sigma-70 family RNA polymerase sigma factor [Dongiaceae bacterium]|nr:sigma-70 family RNA polymerase sigma factor [Dongiaceae bacterium]
MRIVEASEDALLRRAVRGDEQAFLEIYRKHQPSLYRYALRMAGTPWAAEEVVQEVFLLLIREPEKFRPERGELGAFLFGVTRNRVMKHLERTPREASLDQTNPDGTLWNEPEDPLTPMIIAEKQERIQQVREAVLGLPAEFREAVVLCELEELSYEEAAQACGCPVGTIRSRLHRGRALMLAKLELLRGLPRRASAGAK